MKRSGSPSRTQPERRYQLIVELDDLDRCAVEELVAADRGSNRSTMLRRLIRDAHRKLQRRSASAV